MSSLYRENLDQATANQGAEFLMILDWEKIKCVLTLCGVWHVGLSYTCWSIFSSKHEVLQFNSTQGIFRCSVLGGIVSLVTLKQERQ